MVGYKFPLFAAMGKSFTSGVVVWLLILLIAGMIKAKCVDSKTITRVCKNFFSSGKERFCRDQSEDRIKQSVRGTRFRGNITIGSNKSLINVVANSAGVAMQQNF
ncbi:hypothetical protein M3Y96_00456500 [Aphelenchoides besseyi]|nr:hypothetical protein M3Y96_00456500 [Aphelenchoides besseyi]